jgi:hypothetical protein
MGGGHSIECAASEAAHFAAAAAGVPADPRGVEALAQGLA